MRAIRLMEAFVGLTLFASGTVWAQAYPVKPVRVVVVFPPAGATDIVARLVFQKLSEQMNQQFLIDNRAGAGGMIGAEIVAKSPPDGYTVMVYSQTLVANAHLYQKMPYDPLKDFIGVTPLTRLVLMLAVHPQLPARTTKEFIALAKARPNELVYGSAGIGASQHLSMSLLANMAGVKMNHVPYKGGTPAVLAMIGGEIQAVLTPIAEVFPYMKSGRLRPIAVSIAKRIAIMPELPTYAEMGFPGYIHGSWYGLVAPAGTPATIINRLYRESVKVLKDPDLNNLFSRDGGVAVGNSPEDFARFIRAEIADSAKVIKAAKIKL